MNKFLLKLSMLISIFSISITYSQDLYSVEVSNSQFISDSSYEFEIFLKAETNEFNLSSYQCTFTMVDYVSADGISFHYINGSSDLTIQPTYLINVINYAGKVYLTFVSPPGSNIINTAPVRIGKFRIDNTHSFSGIAPEIEWCFEYCFETILTGDEFIDITDPLAHAVTIGTNLTGLTGLTIEAVTASESQSEKNGPEKTIDGLGYFDGSSDSRWIAKSMPQWLIFDLGDEQLIGQTRFSFYKFEQGRVYEYSVSVSNNLSEWTEIVPNTYSGGDEWSSNSFLPVSARYVKLDILSSLNNPSNQASIWEAEIYSYGEIIDNTPPELLNTEITCDTTVVLTFSEPLSTGSAEDIFNYSISNGIIIKNAQVINDNSKVVLNTSSHVLGNNYIVTVNNVEDLGGNVISALANSMQYLFSIIEFRMKIYLEGPFDNGQMSTYLMDAGIIPAYQPYSQSPWNYEGPEYLAAGIPAGTVDWLLIELRQGADITKIVRRKAVLLRNDGIVINETGDEQLTFEGIPPGQYYFVVRHRNHLSIMSAQPLNLSAATLFYDFTDSQTKSYGVDPIKFMSNGVYAMYAADADASSIINNGDRNKWRKANGSFGYKKEDFDLNGGVNATDVNSYWDVNKGKSSKAPSN